MIFFHPQNRLTEAHFDDLLIWRILHMRYELLDPSVPIHTRVEENKAGENRLKTFDSEMRFLNLISESTHLIMIC